MLRNTPVSARWGLKCITGFTLPEMMLALSIGSLIMLGATEVFPKLRKQISILQQHYYLELALSQVMLCWKKICGVRGFAMASAREQRL